MAYMRDASDRRLDTFEVVDAATVGEAEGVAPLDEDGLLPEDHVPERLTSVGLSVSYAAAKGARVPRKIARLRAGQALIVGVIGDSKLDPATSDNVAGDAVTKAFAIVDGWSSSVVTIVNQAQSGHTAFRQTREGNFAAVVAAVPDVVYFELGTNDGNADEHTQNAPGYPQAGSFASIERMMAYLRDVNEVCEFVIILTTPYGSSVGTSNARILANNKALATLAATWGAEVIDGYALFTARPGGWDSLLNFGAAGTHRNGAGNDVLAAEIATHMPATGTLPAASAAPRAAKGQYDISRADKLKGNFGYLDFSGPGTNADGTYALTGTWTTEATDGSAAAGPYDVTTETGAKFELTVTKAREMFAQVDIGSAALAGAYPIVDVYVDDVLRDANVNLQSLSSKNDAPYWVNFVRGLDGAQHKLGLVRKGGKLRIGTANALIGATPTFPPESQTVLLGEGTTLTALPTDGSFLTTPVLDVVLNKPPGWTAFNAVIHWYYLLRVAGQTTDSRLIQARARHASTAIRSPQWWCGPIPTSENGYSGARDFHTYLSGVTGNTQMRLDARVLSTTKTNCYISEWSVVAELVRTA